MIFHRFTLCFAILLLGTSVVGADPATEVTDAKSLAFFESKIRPVLVNHCYQCHSDEAGKSEGGLLLDSKQAIRLGGDSGPAVVPGDPQASLLLTAASHSDPELKMPPKKERLPNSVIADLEMWIRMGAPDPRDGEATGVVERATDIEAARATWAYQRPVGQQLPATGKPNWARRGLDHFILAKLEASSLAPSPDAPRTTFLRRLHFDLIGLPPSPTTVRHFLERVDREGFEAALEVEVDALLASPRFGERWGRHWLDVARFAESSGKETNVSFPYAWRYRDYVIDSVNADKPYDRFLVEQIAGDLLSYESDSQRAELLIATAFLALGPKGLNEMNAFQFLADTIDEQIDTVTQAVMATTVACARCHDHKFDPYTMEDYYALAGIFASTKTYYGTSVAPGNQVGGDLLQLPDGAGQPIFHRSLTAERVASLKTELAALKKDQAEGMAAVQKALELGEDPTDAFRLQDALRIVWRSGAIEGQLKMVDDTGRALPLAMGLSDRDWVIDVPLLERGEINRPGARVPRGFPQVIALENAPQIPEDQSGRLQLALWLTHPDHPLTARVMANRIWHHLFGAGIVRSVDNFGAGGEVPSHPELLDHLAIRFVENGWSVKELVREIVLSRTYRQASIYDADAFEKDPENRLLWRYSKRRLDAEAIRDAMLFVAGNLETNRPTGSLVAQIGDRPIAIIAFDKRVPADLDGSRHRSVYLPIIRDRLPDVLDLFDFAEPSLVTGARDSTNVPLQALYLMNSPFVSEQATGLAERVALEADGVERQMAHAFLICFGRMPDETELRTATAFFQKEIGDAEESGQRQRALASYCQALLATAEFRNLD